MIRRIKNGFFINFAYSFRYNSDNCSNNIIVRLNFTISKVDALLDDISKKLNTVNHVFDVVDKITDSVSLINDRLVDIIVSFLANLFSKRKNKKATEEEEEF